VFIIIIVDDNVHTFFKSHCIIGKKFLKKNSGPQSAYATKSPH